MTKFTAITSGEDARKFYKGLTGQLALAGRAAESSIETANAISREAATIRQEIEDLVDWCHEAYGVDISEPEESEGV